MIRFWRAAAAIPLLAGSLAAQELEPRALQNVPVGMNFTLLAAGYSRGNLLLDPALPLTDARADVWSLTAGFVRSVGVLGLNGRVGAVVPFLTGTWEGNLAGIDTSTSRTGFADPRILLALSFIGAPALTRSEMRNYRQSTVIGLKFEITTPLGQYMPDRLINIGSNRWAFESRLGISQAFGRRWITEAYGAVTLFTRNDDFFGGTTLTQEPFWEVEADAIYSIRVPDIWIAVSFGYGWGAVAAVDGVAKEALENMRASVVLRLPISGPHGLKLVYINGLTTRLGADFDTFQIAYQYIFGGRR